MEFAVLDIGGNFLGPALGLVELGHEVRYWPWSSQEVVREAASLAGILEEDPVFEADVLLYSASFSDEQWAGELGIHSDAELRPEEPLFCTDHPGQAEYRNRWVTDQIATGQALVLIDMGDNPSTSSPFFLETPALRLKRELLPWASHSAILSFPYLYEPHLLHAELTGLLDRLREEARHVVPRHEALFAGTVGHWRYMGRRASMLEQWQDHNPDLPLRILPEGGTLLQTWRELPGAELALSLPGRGELCVRHHELAALSIPSLSLEDFRIEVPQAWREAFPTTRSQVLDVRGMASFYRHHYRPSRAAVRLLELVAASLPLTPFRPAS